MIVPLARFLSFNRLAAGFERPGKGALANALFEREPLTGRVPDSCIALERDHQNWAGMREMVFDGRASHQAAMAVERTRSSCLPTRPSNLVCPACVTVR